MISLDESKCFTQRKFPYKSQYADSNLNSRNIFNTIMLQFMTFAKFRFSMMLDCILMAAGILNTFRFQLDCLINITQA